MNEKSHVGMGYDLCPICHKKHNEVVLLDKRLRNTLERDNFMGFKLCDEHEAMRAEYIALVETSNAPKREGETLKPEDAILTGRIAHVRRTVAPRIFNIEMPDTLAFVYVEPGVIEKLEAMTKEANQP